MYFTAIHTSLQRRPVVLANFMGKTSVITTGRRCARFLSVQQYMNPTSEGGQAVNKVIFLDVDGVLNNGTWAIEMFDKGIRVYHDDLLYEPSLEQLILISI